MVVRVKLQAPAYLCYTN